MKSVDTNLIIRVIMQDDSTQAAQAMAVIEHGVSVPLTVLLETIWVLTSRYGFSSTQAAALVGRLIDLPEITVEAGQHVAWALERIADGADAADMIHLLASRETAGFVTFDRRMVRSAGPNIPVAVEVLA